MSPGGPIGRSRVTDSNRAQKAEKEWKRGNRARGALFSNFTCSVPQNTAEAHLSTLVYIQDELPDHYITPLTPDTPLSIVNHTAADRVTRTMEGAGPSRQFSGLELNAIDTSQRSGPDARDYDTPRDEGLNCPASPAFGLPAVPLSPQSVRKKTKARASRALSRHDSLKEAKVRMLPIPTLLPPHTHPPPLFPCPQVLLVTEMRRSESVLQPELFQYQEHFEFLDAIGKTKFSEVYRVRHRQSNEIFAVKRSRRGFRTKLQRERCLREIRAVSALPAHPNIVGQ
jgi:hypothetical protein